MRLEESSESNNGFEKVNKNKESTSTRKGEIKKGMRSTSPNSMSKTMVSPATISDRTTSTNKKQENNINVSVNTNDPSLQLIEMNSRSRTENTRVVDWNANDNNQITIQGKHNFVLKGQNQKAIKSSSTNNTSSSIRTSSYRKNTPYSQNHHPINSNNSTYNNNSHQCDSTKNSDFWSLPWVKSQLLEDDIHPNRIDSNTRCNSSSLNSSHHKMKSKNGTVTTATITTTSMASTKTRNRIKNNMAALKHIPENITSTPQQQEQELELEYITTREDERQQQQSRHQLSTSSKVPSPGHIQTRVINEAIVNTGDNSTSHNITTTGTRRTQSFASCAAIQKQRSTHRNRNKQHYPPTNDYDYDDEKYYDKYYHNDKPHKSKPHKMKKSSSSSFVGKVQKHRRKITRRRSKLPQGEVEGREEDVEYREQASEEQEYIIFASSLASDISAITYRSSDYYRPKLHEPTNCYGSFDLKDDLICCNAVCGGNEGHENEEVVDDYENNLEKEVEEKAESILNNDNSISLLGKNIQEKVLDLLDFSTNNNEKDDEDDERYDTTAANTNTTLRYDDEHRIVQDLTNSTATAKENKNTSPVLCCIYNTNNDKEESSCFFLSSNFYQLIDCDFFHNILSHCCFPFYSQKQDTADTKNNVDRFIHDKYGRNLASYTKRQHQYLESPSFYKFNTKEEGYEIEAENNMMEKYDKKKKKKKTFKKKMSSYFKSTIKVIRSGTNTKSKKNYSVANSTNSSSAQAQIKK